MRKDHFGTMPDGKEISLYTLENDRVTLSVSDLGALLVRLYVPDRNGRKEDIVLGYDSGEDYLDNPNCFGATVVPVANRTKNASVVIDGTEYSLTDGVETYGAAFVPQDADDDTVGYYRVDIESDVDTDVTGYYEVVYSFEDTEFDTGTGKARLYVVVTEGGAGLR